MNGRSGRVLVWLVAAGAAVLAVAPQALAAPVNGLAQYRNQVSISYDPTSNAVFDTVQGSPATLSYSGSAFQAAGVTPGATVTRGGVAFAWPSTSSGQRDSMSPAGQTIPVAAAPGTTSVALLGASHHGPASASIVLTYDTTDCSGQRCESVTVAFPDWWQPTALTAAANEIRTPFQLMQNALPIPVSASVFALLIPVDPTRQLVSVGFPYDNPAIRIFDLQTPAGTGPAPPAPCP